MINFYSGRPGNGKSLHMAMEIYHAMKKGKNVIANFEINEKYFLKFVKKHPGKLGHFIYMPPASAPAGMRSIRSRDPLRMSFPT